MCFFDRLQKSDKENPKWFMVELTFSARATHFVPLWLIKRIAAASEAPTDVRYLSNEDVKAIGGEICFFYSTEAQFIEM